MYDMNIHSSVCLGGASLAVSLHGSLGERGKEGSSLHFTEWEIESRTDLLPTRGPTERREQNGGWDPGLRL